MYNEDGKELITIEKDYYGKLVEDSKKLDCLESIGVKHWTGYDYAMNLLESQESKS